MDNGRMTKLEAIAFFMDMDECTYGSSEPIQMAIEALKQEPREGEVILTKKEYGELVSSEFDNGYTKGYTEALEQNDVLDKIRAEIEAQEKWLAEAGYNAYNVSVAFGAIKHALGKLGQDMTRKSTRLERC